MKKTILLSTALVAAMTVSFQASAWKTSVYLAAEHESEHENAIWTEKKGWNGRDGANLTTGIVGGFLEEGNFRFDGSFMQSYASTKSSFKKNQNNLGVTYFTTYNGPWGGEQSDFQVRLAYRDVGESKQPSAGAINTVTGTRSDFDLITDEQRNEWWFVPTANYKFNRNFRLHTSYTYRYIDRQLTYLKRVGSPDVKLEAATTSSSIQSGYSGFRYTFDTGVTDFSRNFVELNYYFNKEDLKNTLYNDEHFIWARGYVPFKVKGYIGGVSPYVYYAFKDAERTYYNSAGDITRIEDATRDRFGVRISQNLPNNWSIALDGYYSPRKYEYKWSSIPSEKGIKVEENYTYAYLELLKKF